MRARALGCCLLLAACGGDRLELKLVGAAPAGGFSSPGSPGAGLAVVQVVTFGAAGPQLSAPDALKVRCAGDCQASGGRQRLGHGRGSLAILVDASGSNEVAGPGTCTGCPTDKERKRVAAVKKLIEVLHARAPAWRIAVYDFGPYASAGLLVSRLLAGYTTRTEDLLSGADQLTSGGGTFLHDAVLEVAPTVASDAARNFADGGAAAHLLVVSDGEDTQSTATLVQAMSRAMEVGVPVDTVGFGPASDAGLPIITAKAMHDLRKLSLGTGGFSLISDTDSLESLFESVSAAYDVGLTERVFKVGAPPDAGTPITGDVWLGGSSVPFTWVDPP